MRAAGFSVSCRLFIMFNPAILHPDPDPGFQRQLHIIDTNLRLTFGYERYLVNRWVIERKMTPERYFRCYQSLLEEDRPRYITQPIYDTNEPLYDDEGEVYGYKQVGSRVFDLAPEWEWIATIETKDGKFKQPGNEDLVDLRRQYAWNYTHPLSRKKFEEEEAAKVAAREKDQKQKRVDCWMESIEEAWSEFGTRVTNAVPEHQMEGTEL